MAAARHGRYSDEIREHVSPERLARFFVREDGTLRVVKELRDACTFSEHSLIKDPPFSSLDLISCRNVLIYLGIDLQKKLVPLFHFALRPGGFLLLGPSEDLAAHGALFTTDRTPSPALPAQRRCHPAARVAADRQCAAAREVARFRQQDPPRPFSRPCSARPSSG